MQIKQTKSIHDRLSEFIKGERAKAETMLEGKDQSELLKRARQAETAANIQAWANSPGLQPPK